MIQDLLGVFVPAMKKTQSWPANLIATALAVAGWGYFLYQGVIDPLGGINTLWPLFGISNQMLAAIALTLCTVVLFKMKRQRYAWVTIVPTAWLVICTLTAGLQKLFHANPAIGFLAHRARVSRGAGERHRCSRPPRASPTCSAIVVNDAVDAALCAVFIAVVLAMLVYGFARGAPRDLEPQRLHQGAWATKCRLHNDLRVCDIGPGAQRLGRLLVQTANLMVGIPDYDTYVEHRQTMHPGEPS